MNKLFITVIFSTFILCRAYSQVGQKSYQKYPYWVAMINDSAANYFEAQSAFDAWWSIRPLPVEEDDIFSDEEYREEKSFFDKLIVTRKEKRQAESQEYAFQYKAFMQWKIRMAPWIQPDGSITYPYERRKIQLEMKTDSR